MRAQADGMRKHGANGWLLSPQMPLLGHRDVIGFGNNALRVELISAASARQIITANHYSQTVMKNSTHHFGVFAGNELAGCLQWGYAMNPASVGAIVKGSTPQNMRELNRMWIDDALGRNAESMAISYSIKCLRRWMPSLAWVQSFADERCGRYGVVYQAAGFACYGEHEAVFWELDGEVFHNIAMTAVNNANRGDKAKVLRENSERATRQTLRQWRYLRFFSAAAAKQCLLEAKPAPKHGAFNE